MNNQNITNYKIIFLTLLNGYFNVVVIALMILILIFGFFFVVGPKREAIATDLNKIKNDRLIVKGNLEDLQKKINLYKRSYLKTDEIGRKRIDLMLPSDPGKGELMIQLEELVRKKGLLLQSLTVVPRIQKGKQNSRAVSTNINGEIPPGIGVVDILLKVQGINYKSMKDFLAEFENNLRLMDVVDLGFAPGKSDLNLKIVTYYSLK